MGDAQGTDQPAQPFDIQILRTGELGRRQQEKPGYKWHGKQSLIQLAGAGGRIQEIINHLILQGKEGILGS